MNFVALITERSPTAQLASRFQYPRCGDLKGDIRVSDEEQRKSTRANDARRPAASKFLDDLCRLSFFWRKSDFGK
jgi:hypothetical protein